MTELERQLLVKRINTRIKEKSELQEKLEKLFKRRDQLEKEPIVQEYISVKNELQELINLVSQEIYMCPNDRIIRSTFQAYFSEYHSQCQHPIYLYTGSFGQQYSYDDYTQGHDGTPSLVPIPITNEENPKFSFNSYCCIQCGKTINTQNWQEFEAENTILKSPQPKFQDYRNIYIDLLFYYTVDEAQKLLIERFHQDNQHIVFLKTPTTKED